MTDADKILQAFDRLEAGQKALQSSVEQQGKQLTRVQNTVETQGSAIVALQEGQKTLQEGQKTLQEGQETLELKVETVNASLIRLRDESDRDHKEIMEHLLNNAEISEQDHKAIEKRVERIEKHLNLPPGK